jgi:hypothetical protein
VKGYGRRDCPSCLVEFQATERQAREAKEAEKKRFEEEEEKAFWSRKRVRSCSVECSSSEVSNSSKGKRRANKKQRR